MSGESGIVLVCADGAGSAIRSGDGAKIACTSILHAVASALEREPHWPEITREQVVEWHRGARGKLSLEACRENRDLKDFASTILLAIVSPRRVYFSQIGDGVIVFRAGDGYRIPFWPQQGEYTNTTYFLTGNDFEDQLAFEAFDYMVEEIAISTDGLQPLALHYASRTVHAPFFQPMFATLRVRDPDSLTESLKGFLNSPDVNSRTDDDKTLILAIR